MKGVEELGRKLHELDHLVRAGKLSREDYRKVRRKAIAELEDTHAETIPAARSAPPAASDETIEQRTVPTPPVKPSPAEPEPEGGGKNKLAWVLLAIVAVAAVVAAAVFLPRSKEPAGASPPAGGAPAQAPAPSGPDLPQTLAAQIMKSEWTDADLSDFLARWNAIAPEARRAARDDAGIWLLRGETDRRLREAIDAAALDSTPEAQSRIDRLTALQSAIRAE